RQRLIHRFRDPRRIPFAISHPSRHNGQRVKERPLTRSPAPTRLGGCTDMSLTRLAVLLCALVPAAFLAAQMPDIQREVRAVLKKARDEEVKKREEPQPPVGTDPVTLPEDRNAARKLEAVRDYTNEGSWPEAVRLLQGMLEAREDGFFRLEETDVKGKTTTRWTS